MRERFLAHLSPGRYRVVYCVGAATSTDLALHLARATDPPASIREGEFEVNGTAPLIVWLE